jgi:hypothetical protein
MKDEEIKSIKNTENVRYSEGKNLGALLSN